MQTIFRMEDFLKISVSGGELLYNSDDVSKVNSKFFTN